MSLSRRRAPLSLSLSPQGGEGIPSAAVPRLLPPCGGGWVGGLHADNSDEATI